MKTLLQRLRQLVCIHGPIGHAQVKFNAAPFAESYDFCTRCMKIVRSYYRD